MRRGATSAAINSATDCARLDSEMTRRASPTAPPRVTPSRPVLVTPSMTLLFSRLAGHVRPRPRWIWPGPGREGRATRWPGRALLLSRGQHGETGIELVSGCGPRTIDVERAHRARSRRNCTGDRRLVWAPRSGRRRKPVIEARLKGARASASTAASARSARHCTARPPWGSASLGGRPECLVDPRLPSADGALRDRSRSE